MQKFMTKEKRMQLRERDIVLASSKCGDHTLKVRTKTFKDIKVKICKRKGTTSGSEFI